MINKLNDKLDSLGLIMKSIDTTMRSINDKLDELIKKLHEYDDDSYGESSFEAFMDDEEAANKRMDVIGQNGNNGEHYDDDRELGGEG